MELDRIQRLFEAAMRTKAFPTMHIKISGTFRIQFTMTKVRSECESLAILKNQL